MTSNYDSDDENEIPDIKGLVLNKKYIPIKLLSTSSHSNIWIAYRIVKKKGKKKKAKTHNYCVLKIYDNTDDAIEQAKDEIKYTEKLNIANVPNVIKLLDSFEYNDENYHCMVYPLLACSLYTFIKKNTLTIAQCKSIAKNMLLTLQKIHGSGLLHMDIKPENILTSGTHTFIQKVNSDAKYNFDKILEKNATDKAISIFLDRFKDEEESGTDSDSDEDIIDNTLQFNNEIYLCDFGSCITIKERIKHHTRTEYYIAPEDILNHNIRNESADLWAFACTIYELLTGKILFAKDKDEVNGMYATLLYDIQKVIGPPSQEYLADCNDRIYYYKVDGRLKGWNQYEYVYMTDLLKSKLKADDNEISNIADFILSVLKWNPKDRPSIKKLLTHKWLS